jgi:hypothetical protein
MWRNKLPKAAASLVLMQAVLDRNATRRGKTSTPKHAYRNQAGRRVQHGYARTAAEMVREHPKRQLKVDCDGRAAQTYVPQDILNWVETSQEPSGRFPMLRRNNSLIREPLYLCLGVRAWGDIIMTDSENWKERRNQVARYRAMEQETTDPLAARLLHDIVLDLEAELEGLLQSVGLDAA